DESKARQHVEIPAFFFSSNKTDWKDMGKNTMSVFLNIKNPYLGYYPNYKGLNNDFKKIKQQLMKDGYDGIFSVEDGVIEEYIAFLPNQIKSATDNIGTFDGSNPDIRYSIDNDMKNLTKETETNGNKLHNDTDEGGEKLNNNRSFESEYDKWAKGGGNKRITLTVCNTPAVLKKIGFKNQVITWDATKIAKIKSKHKGMTDDIIKQVPDILEKPIIIMKSTQKDSRITMLGEIYDLNNKPVLVVLELEPYSNTGVGLDEIKIASSYGKDRVQSFINKSEVLYLEPNKKRRNSWLAQNRLQLPLEQAKNTSNNTNISQDTTGVNNIISNKQDIDTKNKHSVADGENDYSKNIEKYGAIPKGENPIRAIKVPKRTSKTNAVSYFARTMLEAESTPDTAISEFEKKIMGGNMVHEVITDKSAKEYALRF
ncbi:MAG: hypothetical protein RSB38_02900, partial [Oscillospiraceae bacterium]